jgi:hypothetical protein
MDRVQERFSAALAEVEVPTSINVGDDVPIARSQPGVFEPWKVTQVSDDGITVESGDLLKKTTREEILRLRRMAELGALPPTPGADIYGQHPSQDMVDWSKRLASLVAQYVPPVPGGQTLKEDLALIPYRRGQDVAVEEPKGFELDWMVSGILQGDDGSLYVSMKTARIQAGQVATIEKTLPIADLTFSQYKKQNYDDHTMVSAPR